MVVTRIVRQAAVLNGLTNPCRVHCEIRTANVRELLKFRNQLLYLHISWNVWYLDLMGEYQQTLDALIQEIELYLAVNNLESI